MILSDNETKVDMLNNRAMRRPLNLLREPRQTNLDRIHGDWGRNLVFEMVEDEFNNNSEIECINSMAGSTKDLRQK